MRLGEIVRALREGDEAIEAAEAEPLGFSIDSRAVREGELFFAIRGERHDGHDFLAGALDKGAIAAVVADDFRGPRGDEAKLIRVPDTLAALQKLASAVLANWRGREVAITGSSGKTTTKELTAGVLARAGSVMKTSGNLNNQFGLPLSVLKMESDRRHASDFDFAVLEMGMNHAGEIAALTRFAPPDLAAVTNVAAVHLEFFPSVEAIGDAKAEIVLGTKPGGAAVLNADDPLVARMRHLRDDIGVVTYGIEQGADVRAKEVEPEGLAGSRFVLSTPRGEVGVSLRLAGRHNVYNALAAAAVGHFYGLPLEEIAEGLGGAGSSRMRGEVLRFKEGFTVIDDSYNSNPRALIEMASTVCASRECRRRVVVAGEMLELGEAGPGLHREAGRALAALGVDRLIGVRGLARDLVEGAREAGMGEGAAVFCDTPQEASEILLREAREGDLILVKGSRGVKTEIVVERLKQRWELG
ncbi:MAG TPA: UDP-N-acetylmuramoyl-tripeptide--D-alanyl-D-alanine ligase [Blastocatellia bacterium]|nr:UDP-N-acetylmuramoyl-tripeptide--D-alanyl-D-alanine ligase [Blastocatellia bacterium]